MVKVFTDIYVGNKEDYYENQHREDLSFCLCAKTFHKQIAMIKGNDFEGYQGNMSKDEPEYLIADREDRGLIALNMIDVDNPMYISEEIVSASIEFIFRELQYENNKILICCDKGKSRSMGIAFIYGILTDKFYDCKTYEEAYLKFKELCPDEEMKEGIKWHTRKMWEVNENAKQTSI